MKLISRLLVFFLAPRVTAFDYSLTNAGFIILTDVATSISPILTLFTGNEIAVKVDGIEWEETGAVNGSDNLLKFRTLVDGNEQASGSMSLNDVNRTLPTSLDVGSISVSSTGRHSIEVILSVDSSQESTSGDYQAYGSGAAIVPLIVVLVLAIATRMVSKRHYLGCKFLSPLQPRCLYPDYRTFSFPG